jgi:protein ImuB
VLVLRCPDWPEPEPEAREVPPLAHGTPGGGAATASPEARAFEPVVAVVEEFCPKVEVLWPGACAIGVRGPARYFGGEQALVGKLTAAVRALGVACQAGVADGLFAAELAAASGPAVADPPATDPPASGSPATDPPASGPPATDPPATGLAATGLAVTGRPAVDPAAPGSAFPEDPRRPGNRPEPGEPGLIVPPGGTPAFLAGQPVSVLGMPDLTSLLPRLGIATLGQFAGLPATEAASRLGAQGLLAHRLARGLDPRPLAPRPPAADLSVRQDFDPPVEQAEPVIFAAKALAEDLHARLAARGLACVRLQVQVRCADGRETTRFWRHDGLLTGLAVAERVRWQLDSWRTGRPASAGPGRSSGHGPGSGLAASPADDGDGAAAEITLLRLIPDQLVRATGRQLGLWGDAVVSDRVARAAVRVQAMLGHGAVTRPVLAGGRRPADQVLLVPFGDSGEPQRPADRPWPGAIPAPAPATVYPEPWPAQVTDGSGAAVSVTGRAQPSGPPAWLSAAGRPALAITAWAGPWPVTEQWWNPARACRQARFQLVTEDGRAWLAVLQDGRWLLEASYD